MPTNRNRSNLITESATLFPDNNTQEISPADLRSWLADGTTSFVTQKDKSTLENAIFENQGSTLAAAATVDLNTATGNYLHISGTGTINSFGTCQAGARFILMFEAAATLTYNVTSLIIPGLANKTAAAGDCCMIVSEGSGNWRIVGYFSISGGGGGGGITALTGDVTASGTGSVVATIANGAVDIAMLSATGSPSATTFLRGDNVWATPSGASPTGYYGAFQDTTTQTAFSANTAYSVKFNTTDLTNAVTVVNDGSGNPTRITLANAGIYNIQFSLQLEKTGGSGNFIVDIWIRKNGVDIPSTTGKVVLTGSVSASPIVAAWNYVLDLAATDYVQLMWSTSNNNAVLLASVATPPHPSVPSAILTVTQQAGIMGGTGITGMVGTSGSTQTGATQTLSSSDMTITSAANAHTFAIPSAGIATKGLVDLTAQTFTGVKTFGNGTSAGEIRLLEGSGSGGNSVGIKAQAMGSNYDLSLPLDAGTAGFSLITDGSGVLSWFKNGGVVVGQFLKNTTATTIPSPITVTTIIDTLLIPAGTFTGNNSFTITHKNTSATSTTSYIINIGINTSAALGGVSILNQSVGAGVSAQHLLLGINLYGGGLGNTTRYLYNPFTSANNVGSSTTAINWSVDQYIVVSATASATRSITNLLIGLTPT
jgi:hypothetical protein